MLEKLNIYIWENYKNLIMKRILLVFLLVSINLVSQEKSEIIEDGKSFGPYTVIKFGGDKNLLLHFRRFNSVQEESKGKTIMYDTESLSKIHEFETKKNYKAVACSKDLSSHLSLTSKLQLGRMNPKVEYTFLNEGVTKQFENKELHLFKYNQLETILIGKNYYTIGHERTGLLEKAKKRNYVLFKVNMESLETEKINLTYFDDFFEVGISGVNLAFLDYTDEEFTLLAYKGGKTYILSFSYSGNLVNEVILEPKKPENFEYIHSNTGSGSYGSKSYTSTSDITKTKSTMVPLVLAYGNVEIDYSNKNYYYYSSISNQKNGGAKSGILLEKYDFDGKLIWSKFLEVFSNDTSYDLRGRQVITRLNINDNRLFIKLNKNDEENWALGITINKETGDILNSISSIDEKAVEKDRYKNSMLKNSKENIQSLKNLKVDGFSLIGASLNSEFANYLKNINDFKGNIRTKIYSNHFVVLESNKKTKQIKLTKYNL